MVGALPVVELSPYALETLREDEESILCRGRGLL
jgi:hypothetical protein